MSYGNTEATPHPSSYPLCYVSSASQGVRVLVYLFVCVLVCADWIAVSGAAKTTDLFTRVSGYLLRRAQETIPAVRSFEHNFARGTRKL